MNKLRKALALSAALVVVGVVSQPKAEAFVCPSVNQLILMGVGGIAASVLMFSLSRSGYFKGKCNGLLNEPTKVRQDLVEQVKVLTKQVKLDGKQDEAAKKKLVEVQNELVKLNEKVAEEKAAKDIQQRAEELAKDLAKPTT